MLLEMLHLREHCDLGGLGHNTAEYLRVVAEVMKRATIDKDRHVGDPAFVDVPVDHLIGSQSESSCVYPTAVVELVGASR